MIEERKGRVREPKVQLNQRPVVEPETVQGDLNRRQSFCRDPRQGRRAEDPHQSIESNRVLATGFNAHSERFQTTL